MAKVKVVKNRIGCKVEATAFLEDFDPEELPPTLLADLKRLATFTDEEPNCLAFYFAGTFNVDQALHLLHQYCLTRKIDYQVVD